MDEPHRLYCPFQYSCIHYNGVDKTSIKTSRIEHRYHSNREESSSKVQSGLPCPEHSYCHLLTNQVHRFTSCVRAVTCRLSFPCRGSFLATPGVCFESRIKCPTGSHFVLFITSADVVSFRTTSKVNRRSTTFHFPK